MGFNGENNEISLIKGELLLQTSLRIRGSESLICLWVLDTSCTFTFVIPGVFEKLEKSM